MRNRGVNDPTESASRQPTRSEGVVHATVPVVIVRGREVGVELANRHRRSIRQSFGGTL